MSVVIIAVLTNGIEIFALILLPHVSAETPCKCFPFIKPIQANVPITGKIPCLSDYDYFKEDKLFLTYLCIAKVLA